MPDNPKPPTQSDTPLPVNNILTSVVEKISSAENILVALSNNPSLDDLSAAIALTMLLDKLGKHATAIFSGKTPNTLEFLEPEKTLEANTNSLQDFIISLNKDKADHLRYKVEGDFVKIFITPYRTQLSEKDLKFSRGEYNVDLVIALNVANTGALDEALAEHGRIMHDASSINITTSAPEKFGDIQWSDPGASSVSEMIMTLAPELGGEESSIDTSIATPLLTGIMSATNRFSNERTTPTTMTIASSLMAIGADQRLVSENISAPPPPPEPVAPDSPTPDTAPDNNNLAIGHDDEDSSAEAESTPEPAAEVTPEPEEAPLVDIFNTPAPEPAPEATSPAPDQSAGPNSAIPEPTPVATPEPIAIPAPEAAPEPIMPIPGSLPPVQVEFPPAPEAPTPEQSAPIPVPEPTPAPIQDPAPTPEQELERIIEPPRPQAVGPVGSLMEEIQAASTPVAAATGKDYGSMIAEELGDGNPAAASAPAAPTAPETNHIPAMSYSEAPTNEAEVNAPDMGESYIVNKPETVIQPISAPEPAPEVASPAPDQSAGPNSAIPEPTPVATPEPIAIPAPEAASAEAIPQAPPEQPLPVAEPIPNPLPLPTAEALPPPPAPFDPNAAPVAPPPALPPVQLPPIQPAAPPVQPEPTSLGQQPAMPDQVYAPQVNDPSAFRLPNT